MVVPLVKQRGWRGGVGEEGRRVSETGERSEIRLKNTIETHKKKIQERIQERKQNDSFAV